MAQANSGIVEFIIDLITSLDLIFTSPRDFFSSIFGGVGGGGFLSDIWQTVIVIFIILDTIFLVAFIFTFIAALKFRPNLKPSKKSVEKVLTLKDEILKERWDNIVKKIEVGTPDAIKVALIDADKLVDDSLKKLGLEGEHMADRLATLFSQDLRSLDNLWKAHKIRNNLVHNPEFEITLRQARKTLDYYRDFLREIRLLE